MVDPLSVSAVKLIYDWVQGHVADDILRRLMKARGDAAREVIAAKMAKGRPWLASEDDTAAAMFTFTRAAQEGAARLNLRLMAEAMVNAAMEPTFAPDVFRLHAATLASLSRDEVRLLAAFARANREAAAEPTNPEQPFRHLGRPWAIVNSDPDLRLDVLGTSWGLIRTGWLVAHSGYGGLVFITSAAFNEIVRLVDFEAELAGAAAPATK